MLKFIFICLLIANALLFALGHGYIESPLLEIHQPQRLLQQQNSENLSLISAKAATASVAATPPIAAPETLMPSKPEVTACLEWGLFPAADVHHIEAKLKTLSFGNRQSRQNAQEPATTMVFIPPLGSREAADKKAAELVHLGVKDFFIIQDKSSLHWGISLGVFKTEEAAKQLLTTLVSKGVRSAKIGVRTLPVSKFNYVFKNVSSAEKLALENLKTGFPAQDLRACK